MDRAEHQHLADKADQKADDLREETGDPVMDARKAGAAVMMDKVAAAHRRAADGDI